MISKCLVLLAVVAQINGYVCNSNYGGSVVATGAASSGLGVAGNTRNIVARGKYPVALENTGPIPDSRVPVTTSHVQAPVQQKPTIRLAANIPAPKTVSHSCTCYKTILRPRVHDQFISVPSVQRYIETSHTPVVENIHYEAYPVNSPDGVISSGITLVPAGSGVAAAGSVTPVASVASVTPVATVNQVMPIASYSTGCSGSEGYYY